MVTIEPLTGSRWTLPDDPDQRAWLGAMLTWPNPIFDPVEIPECFRADPESPKWVKDLLRKTWEWLDGLYPINTERRLQFDGTYKGPGAGTMQLDGENANWVDLIHDHVGEESDD